MAGVSAHPHVGDGQADTTGNGGGRADLVPMLLRLAIVAGTRRLLVRGDGQALGIWYSGDDEGSSSLNGGWRGIRIDILARSGRDECQRSTCFYAMIKSRRKKKNKILTRRQFGMYQSRRARSGDNTNPDALHWQCKDHQKTANGNGSVVIAT